jgi:hypothetical protein
MLPLNLPELEVSGLALVTAIDDCPPIADGEGSVVTARFVTREVHVVASVDVLGADGSVETITGTTIHPVWSVDRQEWVPLSELSEDETLQGLDGLVVVLSVTLSRVTQPVYNIEVHGEHVYQVGELGVLVHNVSRSGWGAFGWGKKLLESKTACVFTKGMLSQSETIARGRSIKKITELVEQFGGTTKGWVKKKGWDAMGQEWHWYEHHGIGRVGVKLAGAIDPF